MAVALIFKSFANTPNLPIKLYFYLFSSTDGFKLTSEEYSESLDLIVSHAQNSPDFISFVFVFLAVYRVSA